jgi:hypothetical protein
LSRRLIERRRLARYLAAHVMTRNFLVSKALPERDEA